MTIFSFKTLKNSLYLIINIYTRKKFTNQFFPDQTHHRTASVNEIAPAIHKTPSKRSTQTVVDLSKMKKQKPDPLNGKYTKAILKASV